MKFDISRILSGIDSFFSVLEEITVTLFWSAFIFFIACIIVLFFAWVFSR